MSVVLFVTADAVTVEAPSSVLATDCRRRNAVIAALAVGITPFYLCRKPSAKRVVALARVRRLSRLRAASWLE